MTISLGALLGAIGILAVFWLLIPVFISELFGLKSISWSACLASSQAVIVGLVAGGMFLSALSVSYGASASWQIWVSILLAICLLSAAAMKVWRYFRQGTFPFQGLYNRYRMRKIRQTTLLTPRQREMAEKLAGNKQFTGFALRYGLFSGSANKKNQTSAALRNAFFWGYLGAAISFLWLVRDLIQNGFQLWMPPQNQDGIFHLNASTILAQSAESNPATSLVPLLNFPPTGSNYYPNGLHGLLAYLDNFFAFLGLGPASSANIFWLFALAAIWVPGVLALAGRFFSAGFFTRNCLWTKLTERSTYLAGKESICLNLAFFLLGLLTLALPVFPAYPVFTYSQWPFAFGLLLLPGSLLLVETWFTSLKTAWLNRARAYRTTPATSAQLDIYTTAGKISAATSRLQLRAAGLTSGAHIANHNLPAIFMPAAFAGKNPQSDHFSAQFSPVRFLSVGDAFGPQTTNASPVKLTVAVFLAALGLAAVHPTDFLQAALVITVIAACKLLKVIFTSSRRNANICSSVPGTTYAPSPVLLPSTSLPASSKYRWHHGLLQRNSTLKATESFPFGLRVLALLGIFALATSWLLGLKIISSKLILDFPREPWSRLTELGALMSGQSFAHNWVLGNWNFGPLLVLLLWLGLIFNLFSRRGLCLSAIFLLLVIVDLLCASGPGILSTFTALWYRDVWRVRAALVLPQLLLITTGLIFLLTAISQLVRYCAEKMRYCHGRHQNNGAVNAHYDVTETDFLHDIELRSSLSFGMPRFIRQKSAVSRSRQAFNSLATVVGAALIASSLFFTTGHLFKDAIARAFLVGYAPQSLSVNGATSPLATKRELSGLTDLGAASTSSTGAGAADDSESPQRAAVPILPPRSRVLTDPNSGGAYLPAYTGAYVVPGTTRKYETAASYIKALLQLKEPGLPGLRACEQLENAGISYVYTDKPGSTVMGPVRINNDNVGGPYLTVIAENDTAKLWRLQPCH